MKKGEQQYMQNKVFESIVGYAEVKQELIRILDQLKNPEKYKAMGVEEPHGLFLNGVPGVGKTTFAKEFLAASGRKSYICQKDKSGEAFMKEIVQTFEDAANNTPSIILLDDLDKYANEDERHKNADEYVTVQTCIDRVKDKQVFVIVTSNNFSRLPESLTRAGRFDHVLEIRCPRGEDAQNIVTHYLSRKPFVADVDVKRISRLLQGKSCAVLETVVNQAGAYAAFDGREQIEMQDMVKAILRVIFKAPESFRKDLRTLPFIAYHEAGHALVAELLEPDSVNLVSVLNHDAFATGITSIYRDDNYSYSKKMMENRLMCVLAGKAATELTYGVVDTGVNSDLRRAFNIAQQFVEQYCSFGFSQAAFQNQVSNEVLERRDSRIAAEMEHYYAQAKQLLAENKDKLDALAKRLLEEKTLLGDQVQQIIKSDAA